MLYFCSQRVTKHIAQPIISFNYGAGNRYRVRKAFRVSFATATICGVLATMFLTSDAVHVFARPALLNRSFMTNSAIGLRQMLP